jgi:hypothetical protein
MADNSVVDVVVDAHGSYAGRPATLIVIAGAMNKAKAREVHSALADNFHFDSV